ncbi:autotransporter domain-containing protein [Fulvimarina endophytica]|uniref:Autotransporter domain-containing protein n=1 Tax=Fulvimarina endophytica TaxID=2293836 RepID=A0A371WY14_9HYPH|nr:autotransporter domain-containing protein [Fulvimarina endophytica]RFC61868.1 autotransporter domain-containing protein [Fulvimarina endophytica]
MNVAASAAGDGSATVSFDPPASNGGAAISGYTVTSAPGGITATGTASPITVTGLANGTAYTFTVTATNAAGTGPAPGPSNAVTPLAGNVALASLTVDPGTLSPAFDGATRSYSVALTNDQATITVTPTVVEPNASVAVGGTATASGTGVRVPLTVGANTIDIVVTAQNGATATYTVTATRAASADARLASLAVNPGALSPAFEAATRSYSAALTNDQTTITVTPTVTETNARVSVGGTPTTSGTGVAVPLAVGANTIEVVVTAQNGTTATYTVTATRAAPSPIALSRTVEALAGTTVAVDLTEGASGGPFTGATIVSNATSSAGTARIEGNRTPRMIFSASSTFAGTSSVAYTLSNASGTSAPATIVFSVIARPDPAQDPEVIWLANAQVGASKRFAQDQIRNYNDRLEQLRDEGTRRNNSMGARLRYNPSSPSESVGDRGVQAMDDLDSEVSSAVYGSDPIPGLLAYGPGELRPSGKLEDTVQSLAPGGIDLGRFAVWTGGYVNFGDRDDAGFDFDYTTTGLSGGIDYRFSDSLVAGFGVGYGRDASDLGENGTKSRGEAYSAAVYGSWNATEGLYIDGLVGAGTLDFDSRRFVTSDGSAIDGERSGRQLFGSLTTAYEIRNERLLLSPYGRVELSRSWLDGFSENSAGIYALTYGDQTVDALSGVLGVRGSYAFAMDWGVLTPGFRVEYAHDFAGDSDVLLGYSDIGTTPYELTTEGSLRDATSFGLSLDADVLTDWSLGLDYRTTFGVDEQNHAFGLTIGTRF